MLFPFSSTVYEPFEYSFRGAYTTVEDSLWYHDSGASHHITNDPSIYSSKQAYHGFDCHDW